MLKLSNMSLYAIKALVYLARQEKCRFVPSQEIARNMNVPETYLRRTITSLVAAGLVQTMPGPQGGSCLIQAAKELSLAAIIEAVDGPIRGIVPIFPNREQDAVEQHVQAVVEQAGDSLRERLRKVTVADLM